MSDLSKRLVWLREQRSLSQRDLAERTGLSYGYISHIESGFRQPTLKTIRLLAAALNVSPHFLETGDEHGAWVYVTWNELLDSAEEGCNLCDRIAAENGLVVAT